MVSLVRGHPGQKKLYQQLSQRYYHHDLRGSIDKLNCEFCQRNKLEGRGYGYLPKHEVCMLPFEECVVDLLEPWVIQVHKKTYEFEALTVINTVTNLVIDKKFSATGAIAYAQCW